MAGKDSITVTVDSEIAEKYRSASESERLKIDWLVNLRLREVMAKRKRLAELEASMREMSRKAQERGLTPEILQSILDDE